MRTPFLGSWASPVPRLLSEAPLLPPWVSRHRGLRSSKCLSQQETLSQSPCSPTSLFPRLVKDTHSGTHRKALTLSTQDRPAHGGTIPSLWLRGRACMTTLLSTQEQAVKATSSCIQSLPATPAVYTFAKQDNQPGTVAPFQTRLTVVPLPLKLLTHTHTHTMLSLPPPPTTPSSKPITTGGLPSGNMTVPNTIPGPELTQDSGGPQAVPAQRSSQCSKATVLEACDTDLLSKNISVLGFWDHSTKTQLSSPLHPGKREPGKRECSQVAEKLCGGHQWGEGAERVFLTP